MLTSSKKYVMNRAGTPYPRSARGLRSGSVSIGQRSIGGYLTPWALHRETGDLLPLSVVEELKGVPSKIAHHMAVAIPNHHGDLDRGHASLERLAGLRLGCSAGKQNQRPSE